MSHDNEQENHKGLSYGWGDDYQKTKEEIERDENEEILQDMLDDCMRSLRGMQDQTDDWGAFEKYRAQLKSQLEETLKFYDKIHNFSK